MFYAVLDIETLNRKEYGLFKEVTNISEEDMFESIYQHELKVTLSKILNDKEIFTKDDEKNMFIDSFAKGHSLAHLERDYNIERFKIKKLLDDKISMIQTKYKQELMKLYNI